jgi:cyclopropane fatty-acyl-phospholipid synthase-like methyltransferase
MNIFLNTLHKVCTSLTSSQPADSLRLAQVQFESALTDKSMFCPQLAFKGKQTVLDVGCGLGGRTVY